MTYVIQQILSLVVVLVTVLKPAKLQIAMFVQQPIYALPPPIAVAVQFPETVTKTTTTTTTTQSPNIAIAVPVPVPMPVQFAVPAPPPPVFCQGKPRPKSCPPCPPCMCMPSCTPSFFSYCSPCHLKCRCRNPEEAPVPMPPNPPVPIPGPAYPLPVPIPPAVGPPPVVVIPLPPSKPRLFPPRRRRPKCGSLPFVSSSSTSEDTSNSCESSSSSDNSRRGKKFKRRRTRIYRRNAGKKSDGSDSDRVKPVLSYVSENGDIKFKTEISSREALDILENRKSKRYDQEETVKLKANENSVVVSRNGRKSDRKNKKVLLRDSSAHHVLGEGKNELLFKPPAHKKINNIAVSFQVT